LIILPIYWFPNLETLHSFAKFVNGKLMRYFETRFLEEANQFLAKLDAKSANKIIYNIDLAELTNDPKLFKKLTTEI
jgi:hypothetical protein